MDLLELMTEYYPQESEIVKEKLPEMYKFAKEVEVIQWQKEFEVADKNPEVFENIKVLEMLYDNAMAIKIKKEDTGYKEENNPESFLLFVGFNGKNFKLKEYQSISEFEDEVAKWIVNSYGKDLLTEMIADQCNHAEKFARKTIELIKEKIQEVKDKNFTVEYLLQPIGLLEKAKRDEAIKTVPSDYMSGMIKLKNVYLFNKEILSGSTKMISDDSGTIKML